MDLKKIGVQEMSKKEMRETDGGILLMLAYCIGSTGLVCYGAFMSGYNAGKVDAQR